RDARGTLSEGRAPCPSRAKPTRGPRSAARSLSCRSRSRLLALHRPDVEPHQHPLLVREIADDLLHRLRQLAHQCGHRQDLVARGEPGVLEQVDDLDRVLPLEVLFTEALEIADRGHALGGLPRDVEPQLPAGGDFGRLRLVRLPGHGRSTFVCRRPFVFRPLPNARRLSPIACRSEASRSRRRTSSSMLRASFSSSTLNCSRSSTIRRSRASRRRWRSCSVRAISSALAVSAARSSASLASRADPVSTPPAPR